MIKVIVTCSINNVILLLFAGVNQLSERPRRTKRLEEEVRSISWDKTYSHEIHEAFESLNL